MLPYSNSEQFSGMWINLGSGPVKGENGWINIDLAPGADLSIDITRGLPFHDNQVTRIYTSHFLEHLYYPDLCSVLKECHRVLKPGCEISVCVPDARRFIDAYVKNDYVDVTVTGGRKLTVPTFLSHQKEGIYAKALVATGSPIDWINYIAYSNAEHRYLFDKDNLLSHLTLAGFINANRRPFDPSIDKEYGKHTSIFAKAYKE